MPIGGEEKELIRRSKRGDREAFLKLIQPYYERVYRTSMRLLGNPEDAAEVTQEAILKTFWKIQTFHGHSHFYTWLYRTALNLSYRRLSDTHAKIKRRSVSIDQSQKPEEKTLSGGWALPDDTSSPREEAIHKEEAQLVRKALARLHPKDFQVLILREFEGLSYEDISVRLRIPHGTVMSRLHRARKALAIRLRALGLA
jgi:RNA polymerase sigma factor (sigma-70 family)